MARFTEVERVEVWDRWQAGVANRLIGRDLGRSAGSIRAFVESWGGVRPPIRRRSCRHLSLIEREEISRGVAAGHSLRMVATRLGRAPSTITRELAGVQRLPDHFVEVLDVGSGQGNDSTPPVQYRHRHPGLLLVTHHARRVLPTRPHQLRSTIHHRATP